MSDTRVSPLTWLWHHKKSVATVVTIVSSSLAIWWYIENWGAPDISDVMQEIQALCPQTK